MAELSKDETALVDLLAGYEKALAERRATVHVMFTIDSLTWIATSGVTIAHCQADEKNPALYHAYFSKWEYCKYIHMCCKYAGFQVAIDGTVRNKENEVVLLPPAGV